jgi:magnesium transporter
LQQNEEVKALSEASIEQDDQVKKISAWAAILFAPTLVGTVYGMNFDYMPELHWTLGYPFALMLMLAGSISLYSYLAPTDSYLDAVTSQQGASLLDLHQ